MSCRARMRGFSVPGARYHIHCVRRNTFTVHTSDGKPPYGEAAVMDFVWDGNHNLAHKTTWWWDAMPDNDDTQTEVRNCYTGVLVLLLVALTPANALPLNGGYRCCVL
jgi:hypothetical protein